MNYKGFYIDEDFCDHSVQLIHKEYGIKKTFHTTFIAQQYVDGWMDSKAFNSNSHFRISENDTIRQVQ